MHGTGAREGAPRPWTRHTLLLRLRQFMRLYFHLREGRVLVTVLISRRIHFSIHPVGHTSVQAMNLQTEGLW